MPIAKSYPIKFVPKGLTDAFDATEKFMGACQQLTNFVFDQSNPELVVSRPGVTEISDFTGFITPGVVSVQITVGTRTYGMVASGLSSGHDEPFIYDHEAAAFVVISGVDPLNVPTSQATTGAWTPPTIAVVGTNIIVTHPGFPGAGQMFGVIDVSNPALPAWSATDCGTNGLSGVPSAVANFNNRAYFSIANAVEYTDSLSLVRTSANQALTIGDTADITALSGLPVQTTSAGVVQALLIFKALQVWQVTGDSATSTLALNFLSLNVGTSAPRSLALSPLGLYFASTGGPYIIDQLGTIRPVTHGGPENNPDIVAPFQNAVTQSRIAAAYNAGIYRVCIDTVIQENQATRDYWFDERRRRWSGPHTFAYDCASAFTNYTILVANDNPALLIASQVLPDRTSVYDDLDEDTIAELLSSTFPKTGHMAMKQMIESTIELSSSGTPNPYQITASDDAGNTLDTVTINVAAAGPAWGAFVWGDGTVWSLGVNRPRVYTVPWTDNIVFKKIALAIRSTANAALAVGAFYGRWSDCGYTNYNNQQTL